MIVMTAAGPAMAFYRAVVIPLARGSKWIITGQVTVLEQEAASTLVDAAESP